MRKKGKERKEKTKKNMKKERKKEKEKEKGKGKKGRPTNFEASDIHQNFRFLWEGGNQILPEQNLSC